MPAPKDVPYDLEAEEAALGAAMLTRGAVEVITDRLVPGDFYSPVHRAVFIAVGELWATGHAVDPVTVAASMVETTTLKAPDGGWRKFLLGMQGQTPASANVDWYAETIADRADRRGVIEACGQGDTTARDLTVPVETVIDGVQVGLAGATRAGGIRTHPNYEDWSLGVDMDEKWLVPDILERGDRVILVAVEGAGKSTILRQWGIMCAAGVHWFSERRMEPSRTLIIDVENSPRQIVRNTRTMFRRAGEVAPGWDQNGFTIMPRPTLDLTSRADRLDIESYLAGHRPDVLVIGPLYKILPPPGGNVTYEQHALRGIRVIDDWRARYDIAVLIEHHAPKGSQGRRDLDPLGSSAWLRWPEYGLRLELDAENPQMAKLGHFRGQREIRPWPRMLQRGGPGQWQWRTPPEERLGTDPRF